MNDDDIIIGVKWRMENAENEEESLRMLDILVMTSAREQLLGRIFSMHSPSIRLALKRTRSPSVLFLLHYYHTPTMDILTENCATTTGSKFDISRNLGDPLRSFWD